MSTHWSLGVLIGLPAAAIILVGLLVAVHYLRRWRDRLFEDDYDRGMAKGAVRVAVGAAIMTPLITAMFMYPFGVQYHQWQPHGGTVTTIDYRLIGGNDGGTQTKYAVRFAGSNQQFGCSDTRCASVHVGDDLRLSCKRTWQYASTDGYDCVFVSLTPAGS